MEKCLHLKRTIIKTLSVNNSSFNPNYFRLGLKISIVPVGVIWIIRNYSCNNTNNEITSIASKPVETKLRGESIQKG